MYGRRQDEDINVYVRPVGAVTARQQVDSIERVVAGTDVHCECLVLQSVETMIHLENAGLLIHAEQTTAALCNVSRVSIMQYR